jgi:hypothetical protein
MLDFFRNLFAVVVETDDTGTFPDAYLQMTELQKDKLKAREDGHRAHVRDYGKTREIYRRSMGFA